MLQFLRKKFLLVSGLFFTILLSFLSFLLNRASKDDSLFISTANADIAPYTGTDAGGGSGGSGCGGCSGGGCLPAGTLISTPSGNKNIESVVVGDVVFGFDPSTKKIAEYPVVNLTSHGEIKESALVVIDHEMGKIMLTDGHLLHKEGGFSEDGIIDFVEARNVKVGDALTVENGKKTIVTAVYEGQKNQPIYNFEVDKVHTYIANGVIVHNDGS